MCTALVTRDGAPVAEATGAVRAAVPLKFPTQTVAAATIFPDLERYAGMDGARERFTHFTLTVEAACDDRDLLEKLVTMAERSAKVTSTNTLRQSTPIEVRVVAHGAVGGVTTGSERGQ